MKKSMRISGICVLLCLCFLLSGCREDTLQTVHTSACEMLENGEECSVAFFESIYVEEEVSQDLIDLLNPSHWERSNSVETDTRYCAVRLTIAELEFYEGNVLCVTMADTNAQEWYVSDADIYEQLKQYKMRYGMVVLPELSDYVEVCR